MILPGLEYLLWNGTVIGEIERGLEGSDYVLMKVLSWYLPGGTEGTVKDCSQDILCPGHCLNCIVDYLRTILLSNSVFMKPCLLYLFQYAQETAESAPSALHMGQYHCHITKILCSHK